MNKNNVRFDLSPFLIHFFRKIDLDKADISFIPEEWGPGAIVEDTSVTPFFLLRNAVRTKRLWATWSMRNGKRTVYGPNAAVCFTDMPIAAFIEAGEARAAKGEAMSPIAVVLPRNYVHAGGARPAIYGLSTSTQLPCGNEGMPRIFSNTVLPEAEQYRYVTLGNHGSVDWTHEREWRWPFRGGMPPSDGMPPDDGANLPGLDLGFSGMGVIVETKDQAEKILHDILVLRDQHAIGHYSFILAKENIASLTDLREPSKVQAALSDAAIDLDQYFKMTKQKKKALVTEFDTALKDVDMSNVVDQGPECGGCWLWLTDAKHEITRAMVLSGRVEINQEGRYLINLPFDQKFSLSRREELTRRLGSILSKRHNLASTYHSVLGSSDIDGVPHYSDPPLENHLHFNWGSN